MEDLVKHLFDLGMYARGWAGPGEPYPISDVVLNNNLINPNTNPGVLFTLLAISDIFTNKPEVESEAKTMPIMRYKKGEFFPLSCNIYEFYNKIASGTLAMRIASHDLIATSTYYGKEKFNASPYVNLDELKRIC